MNKNIQKKKHHHYARCMVVVLRKITYFGRIWPLGVRLSLFSVVWEACSCRSLTTVMAASVRRVPQNVTKVANKSKCKIITSDDATNRSEAIRIIINDDPAIVNINPAALRMVTLSDASG